MIETTGKYLSHEDNANHPSVAASHLVSRLNKASVSQLNIQLGISTFNIGSPTPDVPVPLIRIVEPVAMMKSARRGLIGLAESYIDGNWETTNLQDTLDWSMANEEQLMKSFSCHWLFSWLFRIYHRLNNNSRKGSRKNIAAHYDLGNDFYQLWLDPGMSYSSALFQHPNESLEVAQNNKYAKVLQWLDIKPDSSVLEIGCGWGGFAKALQQSGGQYYQGVTLSQEQLRYAIQNVTESDTFQFHLRDYRDISGQYDSIASIEMLEAVGESHWPHYFQKVYDSLKPGGTAVIQVITIDEGRFEDYRKETDFIQQYIFPGGMLPTHSIIQEQCQRAGLEMEDTLAFGHDYATTLAIWADAFNRNWPDIARQGFDSRFRRLWNFYLAYCQAGFKHNSIDVRLYRLRKA